MTSRRPMFYFKYRKYFFENSIFKVYFCIFLFVSIIVTYGTITSKDALFNIEYISSSGVINVTIFSIFVFNAIKYYTMFNDEYMFIIRFKGKNECKKNLFKQFTTINEMIFLMYICLLISVIFFMSFGKVKEIFNTVLNVSYFVTIPFQFLRIFLILDILTKIVANLYTYNKKIMFAVYFGICSMIFFGDVSRTLSEINSLKEFPLFFTSYFDNNVGFSNVLLFSLAFCIQLTILYFINYLIEKRIDLL